MSFASGTMGWPAPPGVTPNFVDPESFAPRLIIVAAVVMFLSTFFLTLRIWTRVVLLRRVGYEDCMFVHGSLSDMMLTICFLDFAFGAWVRFRFLFDIGVLC